MKTILVTGASGSLGNAVVEHLHQQGYTVQATVRSDKDIVRFDHLPHVKTTTLDVLDARRVSQFIEHEITTDVEAAVLLVGGFARGTLAQTDERLLHDMYALNFLSAFNVVSPLLTRFAERGGGQFILIGARPALHPDEGRHVAAYALSKALVFSLAELINAEGKITHTTATVIVPGIIDTPANRTAMPAADPAHWVPPAKLAELIGFLQSDTGRMSRETVIKFYNQS